MNRYPRRLIEVDLPIKRISIHARREKSIRHGHISTLHIWWARRPLAACRAVILAALWPDPAPGPDDPPCPPAFLDAARTRMIEWAVKNAEKASAESFPRLKAIQDKPTMLVEQPLELRSALLDFIADFANWDNSTVPEFLATSRALTQAAHEALGGAPGTRPLVVDPFAGGGSIPLEALRVGADAFASDLNPVAVLLNKVVLEYIPKYGQRLADEVRKWGAWIKEEAEKELGQFYPKDPDGATPIAYLWARTVQCEGPGCGAEVPLIRSLWLAKKAKRSVGLQLVPLPTARRVDLRIIVKQRGGWVDQDDPKTRIEEPRFDGTVKRGSATCPCCGYTNAVGRVRHQLAGRRGGADDARMLAVVTLAEDVDGRRYKVPTAVDLKAAQRARESLVALLIETPAAMSPVPTESFTGLEPRRIPLPQYGMNGFADMFSSRQLLSLATISSIVRTLHPPDADDTRIQDAVRTSLALALSKEADLTNSLCGWKPDAECPVHLFARQAMPMVWDFAEAVPISSSSGSWASMVERTCSAIESCVVPSVSIGHSAQFSASRHSLPSDSAAAAITDPPYYYSVPYADLSDFFYVWLRRCLSREHPQLFRDDLTPKDEECVQNLPHSVVADRQKSRQFYERQMTDALSELRRVTRPDGIATVVFAHSETDAWEALVAALVSAGWQVTASWPIDTEMTARVIAQRQRTLASSVHLACRPRENPDGSVRTNEVGDWRDVLSELPRRIHDWMPRLAGEGVVGADAIFACLGPALEIFSRYSHVRKASGEAVTLREYLEHVWAAVSTEALSMIFDDADAAGLEPDARLTAMWLWTLGSARPPGGQRAPAGDDENDEEDDDEGEESDGKKKAAVKGFSLEFDAARKIAQGLGIHLDRSPSIVEVKGDTARLLPVVERTPYLFGKDAPGGSAPVRPRKTRQRKLFEELEAVEAAASGTGIGVGLTSRPTPGRTALDRVHQAMILFAVNRGDALKQFLVDDRVGRDARFWKLAQSLSALYPGTTDEKRWVDGVLSRKKGLGL